MFLVNSYKYLFDNRAVKIFDIVNFDMINILQLNFIPARACWIFNVGDLVPEVAIAETDTNNIHIFDGKVNAKQKL